MSNIINIIANGATKAQTGLEKVNTGKNSTDLEGQIGTIINAVIGFIGIVAVVVIIIGGVNYTTSQGDPAKTKKAKDTILYGVIGLVVSLLAFAIVNFVLVSMGAPAE